MTVTSLKVGWYHLCIAHYFYSTIKITY